MVLLVSVAIGGLVLAAVGLVAWREQMTPMGSFVTCPSSCTCHYSWLSGIAFINCSHLTLRHVPPGIPKAANEIDLSYNQLINLTHFPQPKLRKLDLTSNRLDNKQVVSFSDQVSSTVEELRLGNNKLTELLVGLPSTLKYLDLCQNRITALSSVLISALPLLEVLILAKNDLGVIEADSFCPRIGNPPPLAATLRRLDLSRNRIHTIEPSAFSCLVVLEELNLRGNSLRSIKATVFEGLSSLELLDLHRNHIESVENRAFVTLTSLSSLRLSRNQLSSVPRDLPVNLAVLDLSYNQITEVKKDASLLNVKVIFVSHNPLKCNQDLLWIKSHLARSARVCENSKICFLPPWLPVANESYMQELVPRCESPATLAGRALEDLNDDNFQFVKAQQTDCHNNQCQRQGQVRTTKLSHKQVAKTAHLFFGKSKPPCFPDLGADGKKWITATPISPTVLFVQWTLPPAFENYIVEVQFYLFGHRDCKSTIVDIPPDTKEEVLFNLKPGSDYVVCVVTRHDKDDPPVRMQDLCVETYTPALWFYQRFMNAALSECNECHPYLGPVFLFLLLGGLLLMGPKVWKEGLLSKYITGKIYTDNPIADKPNLAKCFTDNLD